MGTRNNNNNSTVKSGVVSNATKTNNVLTIHSSLPRKKDKEREEANAREVSEAKAYVSKAKNLKSDMETYHKLKTTANSRGNMDMGVENTDAIKADREKTRLMKLYNVSSEDFDNEYKSYSSQKTTEAIRKNKQNAFEYAKEHPVLASAKSVGNNLLSSIEGVANTVALLQGGKLDTEKDYILSNKSEAQREGAKSNIKSDIGKKAYDLGMSAADMAAQSAIGLLTGGGGTAMGALQGAQTANDMSKSSLKRGNSSVQAGLEGLGGGLVTAGLTKWGVDDILGNNSKSVAGALLRGARNEGLEEGAETLADTFISNKLSDKFNGRSEKDEAMHDYKLQGMTNEQAEEQYKKDKRSELLQSVAAGALFGGVLGGGNYGVNKIKSNIVNSGRTNTALNDILNGNTTENVKNKGEIPVTTENVDISNLNSPINTKAESTPTNTETTIDEAIKNDNPLPVEDKIQAVTEEGINNGLTVDEATQKAYDTVTNDNNNDINELYADIQLTNRGTGISRKDTDNIIFRTSPKMNQRGTIQIVDDIVDKSLGRNGKAETKTERAELKKAIREFAEQGNAETYDNLINARDTLLNKLPETSDPNEWATREELTAQIQSIIDTPEIASNMAVENMKSVVYVPNTSVDEKVKSLMDIVTGNNNEYIYNNYADDLNQAREFISKVDGATKANTPTETDTNVEMANSTIETLTNNDYNTTPKNITTKTSRKSKSDILLNPENINADRETVNVNAINPKEGKSRERVSNTYSTMNKATLQNLSEDIAKDVLGSADEYKYSTKPRDKTFREGMEKFNSNPEETVESYIRNSENIRTDADVDAAMLAKTSLEKMYAEAEAKGDIELADQLKEKIRDLRMSIREAGTSGGRFVNAFKEWAASDYEAVEIAAYDLLRQRGTDAIKNNSVKAKKVTDTASDVRKTLAPLLSEYKKATKLGNDVRAAELKNQMMSEITSKVTDEKLANKLVQLVIDGKQQSSLESLIAQYEETGKVDISKETLAEVEKIYEQMKGLDVNSKEHVDLETKAYKLLADEICGSTFMDKWNAWRYFAMLSKPKTHIRNVLGNKVFGASERISDRIAGALEQNAIKKGKMTVEEATKSGKKLDSEIVGRASKYFDDHAYGIYNGNKYQEGSVKGNIESNKSVFNKDKTLGKIANKAYELNSDKLSEEDVIAGRKAYSKAMADYIQAKGYNESIFSADEKYRKMVASDPNNSELGELKKQHDLLNKASDYAMRKANEATFHEDNEVAQEITNFSKKMINSKNPAKKALGMLVEGIVPFKKTPMNILKQGVKYSPFEYAQVLSDFIGVKKGNVSRTKLYEDASKAVTGTIYLAIGAFAASQGILKGQASEGEKAQNIKDYSINVGGYSVPIDFLAPGALPVLSGATLYEKWKENNGSLSFGDFFNSLTGLTNPIIETSMLSGINDILETISYANTMAKQGKSPEGAEIASGLIKAGTSYITQGIPGIVQSAAQTIDPVYRSARATNTGNLGIIEQAIRQSTNKIPMLSLSSPESVNVWGDTNKVGSNAAMALFNSAINPTSVNKVYDTKGANMATELEKQGYGKAVISKADQSVPIYNKELGKSENIRLNGKEYETASKVVGKVKSEALELLANNSEFASLTPELQESIIHNAYAIGDKAGYEAAKPNEYSSDDEAYNIYKDEGMQSAIDYLVDDVVTASKTKQIKDEYGISITKDQYRKKVEDGTLNSYIENAVLTKEVNDKYDLKLDADDVKSAKKAGLSLEEYGQVKQELKAFNEEYDVSMSVKEYQKYMKKGGQEAVLKQVEDRKALNELNEEYGIEMNISEYQKAMEKGGAQAIEETALVKAGVQKLRDDYDVEVSADQYKKWASQGASKDDIVFMGNLKSSVSDMKDEGMSDELATVAYLAGQNISDEERSKYILLNSSAKDWNSGYKARGIKVFGESAAYKIISSREVAKQYYDLDGNGSLKQSEIRAFVDDRFSDPNERAKWYYVLTGKNY